MKNKLFLFSSLGVMPAAFSPVMAADAQNPANVAQLNLAQGGPPPLVYNWTGFYAGLNFGINSHRTKAEADIPNSIGGGGAYCWDDDCGFKDKDSSVGVFGGVHAGFNFQFGNIVVGPEIDFGGSSARSERRVQGDYGWSSNTGLEALGTARLRLGFAFDRTLIYATGGGALGKVVSEFQAGSISNYSWSNQSNWRVGYVAGGGVEFALPGNLSVKGEGLYYSFTKSKSHNSTENLLYAFPTNFGLREKMDGIVGRVGLSMRF